MASLTCINAMFNGTLGPYSTGMCPKTGSYTKETVFNRVVPDLAKYLMLV